MKKSIFLFFAAILCAIGVQAANITSDGTARLYFNMSAVSWWTAGTNGDGNFAYFYGSSGNKWSAHSVKHSGNDYYVVIPAGTWDHVILTRNSTSTSPSWDNKWNQTGNIALSSSSNYLSKFSADSESVTWGTAIKPTSTASVASSAASVFVGVPANLTASLTSNANINTIKSVAYSTTTGASITGNTFTATAEGTYTVTATVTYHPNGYPSLTSTATATTTITAAVPAEEVHDVTVSYMCGGEGIADATTVLSVGVETPVKVTAPEIAKYTFANWTLGAGVATTDALTSNEINITTKEGGSDFNLVANYEKAKLTYTVTVPAGTENCYLVGDMNEWDVDNPIEMANQGNNVFKVVLEDVTTDMQYKYISKKGTWDYSEVGDNRTWKANDVVTAWKDPLITNVYLYGAMNGWKDTNPFKKETKEASTASVTVTLEAGTDYEFKIVDDGKWKSNATAITGTITGWTFTEGGGNAKLTTVAAGDYVFTWEMSTSKLSIAYPEVTPEYKDITIQVYANEVPNIWWWNGGDQCPSTEELTNPSTGNKYKWDEAPAMEAVVIDGNTWYQKKFVNVDVTKGGIKFKLQSADHKTATTNEVTTTEDKCYDARVIATVTETPCGQLPTGETPKVTYNVEVPAGTNTCYIAGEMNSWTLTEMTKVDDTHYTITIEGATTAHKYKYSSGPTWDWEEVISGDRTYSPNDVVTAWKSVYDPSAPVYKYYIVGSMNSWNQSSADYGMTDDDEDGIYEKTLTLKNNDEFKVKGNDWYGFDAIEGAYVETSLSDENDRNIKITLDADKEVTVKFNSETKEITFEGLTEVETETLVYTVEVPEGTEDCYIAGQMNNWEFDQMTQVDATHWTITYDNVLKTTEYKYACQADWDYVEKDKDGNDLANNRTWKENDKVENWGKPVIVTYQLKGVGGWEQPGIELVQNPGNDKEYMLTCQAISATDAIKVVRLEDGVIKDYYGNGTVKDGVTVDVSYDGEANIKLPEGKYNFYFDTNEPEKKLWIAAATDCGLATITLTTGNNDDVIAANIGNTVNVVIERSFTANAGYYTLCVPFNMDPSVIGKAYSLGTITEHVAGEGINIELEEETYMLSAGVPYLVLPKANMSELVVENVTIESVEASGQNVTNGEGTVKIFFEGFYSASGQTNGTTQYYVGNNGYLYNEVVDIRGLCGLFTITDENGDPLKVRARVVTREEVETGIDNNQLPNTNIQKVLENGQLIIIREGVKYNVQGQKL